MKDKYNIVLACGGFGTRLRDVTKDLPKPLFPLLKKSTLERCIEQLSLFEFKKIFITIGYQKSLFAEYINKFKNKYKINIQIFEEQIPMGECGALWDLKNKLSEKFIFINGDLIFSLDFQKLISFHERLNSSLTLVSHTSDHPEDSDLISAPNGTLIENIFLKNIHNNSLNENAYLGNAGIFVVNKNILDKLDRPKENDSKSFFHYIVNNLYKKNHNIFSYNTTEYIKDMGTPTRLKIVEKDIINNRLLKKNYRTKQRALFLDRDNTLIKCEKGDYVINLGNVEFIDKNIMKIVSIANNFDFVCMVTNQPTISMGLLSIYELESINSMIIKYCLSKNLKIDVITFCPHHPHSGFDGEVSLLKKDCFCRKPNPGLFFEQAFLRNIDLSKSLMIGDSDIDKLASQNAGCLFQHVDDL